jgi:hypothetical protein
MFNLNTNAFLGTHTASELDTACQLLESEKYTPPVFNKNTLAAYSEPLMILESVSPCFRVKLSRYVAQAYQLNQVRLLDLFLILS